MNKTENNTTEGTSTENHATKENRTQEDRAGGNRAENTNTEENKVEDSTKEAFTVTGDWTKQSQQLQSKYSQLTSSDLEFEPGKESEMIGRVQSRLSKNRAEVISILKENRPKTN